jgi:deoxyribodipyrimidine photo-lyase
MWFASIWIFTLRLPWELGADFFLRHLLDGDPASNTLGWRWVAGLQTVGKTYLARPDNIKKYTNGRFTPTGLATKAVPLTGPENPPCGTLAPANPIDTALATGLLIHDEDLDLTHINIKRLPFQATAILSSHSTITPLKAADHVVQFAQGALCDTLGRLPAANSAPHTVKDVYDLIAWAQTHGLKQIITCYAPVGPIADQLTQARKLLAEQGILLVTVMAPYDRMTWPHATRGFFRFKDNITHFIAQISQRK